MKPPTQPWAEAKDLRPRRQFVASEHIHPCHCWLMAGDGSRARDLRALYSPRGMSGGLQRTLPLTNDERVIIEGTLRLYHGRLRSAMGYIRLTNDRLLLLHHYAAHPDRVTEVPPGALRTIDRTGRRVELTWTGADEQICSISLAPWSRLMPLRQAIKNLDQLTGDLQAWRPSAR
jgi:hypothetical protein